MLIGNVRIGYPLQDIQETQIKVTDKYIENVFASRRLKLPKMKSKIVELDAEEFDKPAEEYTSFNAYFKTFESDDEKPFLAEIRNDTHTLNPYLYEVKNINRCSIPVYVSINISEFIPVFYELPEGSMIRETFHAGKPSTGFLIDMDINAKENTLLIFGKDLHQKDPKKAYCGFSIRVIKTADAAKPWNIKIMHVRKETGVMQDKIFKAIAMHKKYKKPKSLSVRGPFVTKYYCGLMPQDEAIKIIDAYFEKTGYESDKYIYIQFNESDLNTLSEDGCCDEVVSVLDNFARTDYMRAITIVGEDMNIRFKEAKKIKLNYVLRLTEEGTLRTVISN